MSLLFRRREIWLPTLWGWLLAIALAAAAAVAGGLGLTGFLSAGEPARGIGGRGARTLVVEGWIGRSELDQAVIAVRSGHYEQVLATGGPIETDRGLVPWASYAERAAAYLQMRSLGIPVVALPTPATARDRTFTSALTVRDWAAQRGEALDAIDLFSAGVHLRRSRTLFRLALGPTVEVGSIAAHPVDAAADSDGAVGADANAAPAADRWWRSSQGTKTVLSEALALAWTTCCFWPAVPPPAPLRAAP